MKLFLRQCCMRYAKSYSLPGMAFLVWFTLLPAWDFFQLVAAMINPPHQPKIYTLSSHIIGPVWILGAFLLMSGIVATSIWHSFREDWGRWAVHSFFLYFGIALAILYIILDYYILGFCRISGY